MRRIIEISDHRHFQAFVASAQATQQMEERLGEVRVENVVLGMQHQLGNVAALTMAQGGMNQEIADDLLGLIALATIYLKSLITEACEDESQHG